MGLLNNSRRCFPVYHKNAFAAYIPLLAITFVPNWDCDVQVLEQPFFPVFKDPPYMIGGAPSGLPTGLIEADAELAQMTSALGGSAQDAC
jgi:hypothetical protein